MSEWQEMFFIRILGKTTFYWQIYFYSLQKMFKFKKRFTDFYWFCFCSKGGKPWSPTLLSTNQTMTAHVKFPLFSVVCTTAVDFCEIHCNILLKFSFLKLCFVYNIYETYYVYIRGVKFPSKNKNKNRIATWNTEECFLKQKQWGSNDLDWLESELNFEITTVDFPQVSQMLIKNIQISTICLPK